jgi:hypothetical protein
MTERHDPAAYWLTLGEHLHRGELPPPEVRAWICRATTAMLKGVPIGQALGLHPAGPSFATRDQALRDAGQCLAGDPHALAAAVARFESCQWPRWRHLPAAPETAQPLQRHLHRAFRTGLKMPQSPKHLRRILRDKNAA